ncbi:hypothetical protein MLD38_002348 [Melastoma candidum]|uniref:Uncharacterized protein n=1 Tax=Melastoma candidum TaxID=119954 RepID=A0ACB9RZ19_9MYRT|nr:hypothetical protein MLD38_002348 [Melastoma candidum]
MDHSSPLLTMFAFFESCPPISSWDAVFGCIVFFLCGCVFDRLTNKGPMLWPVLGIMPSIPWWRDNVYEWSIHALKKAGGTFHFRGAWFGKMYGIVTVDPANVEYMLKTNFRNFRKGKYYRERFVDLLGDGIFNADDELWKEQRRAAASEMHSPRFVHHSFRSMQELVHDKLMKILERMAESCGVIDLQDILLRFTFDNICCVAFGVDSGCLSPELHREPFAKAFEESTELSLFRFLVPPYIWKPMRALGLGTERQLKEAVQIVHHFANKTVSDRRS